QKLGGFNLTFGYLYQLPVLPPTAFTPADIAFIVPRVLELVYTAWDIKAFAEDVWEELRIEHAELKKDSTHAVMIEILHRNAECNAEAPDDLFPETPGINADGSVDFSLLTSQLEFCKFARLSSRD